MVLVSDSASGRDQAKSSSERSLASLPSALCPVPCPARTNMAMTLDKDSPRQDSAAEQLTIRNPLSLAQDTFTST
ncbi:GL14657 [Drosophila persimilis]|uniref:GL14657 n=1 Tax=Drosophila persimilis TaxID=7234 RepID=B4GVK6_DROPE|nr:GL14657 [Drosophila persimilis]